VRRPLRPWRSRLRERRAPLLRGLLDLLRSPRMPPFPIWCPPRRPEPRASPFSRLRLRLWLEVNERRRSLLRLRLRLLGETERDRETGGDPAGGELRSSGADLRSGVFEWLQLRLRAVPFLGEAERLRLRLLRARWRCKEHREHRADTLCATSRRK
jgi:hypothetical protein